MSVTEKLAWFKNAKLGLFVHWGLYSLLGRGEWVMYRERIPAEEYAQMAALLNPAALDFDRWCLAAKRAGMKYMVFTTCHHDGFALFDSKADSFNSVAAAPCHRDFVAEYVAACRRHGLGVGLYYSLGDWRFGIMKESDSGERAEAMRDLTFAQVRELMTQYGPIDILWYDGGWCYPSTPQDTDADVARFWHAEELNRMVRSLQPDILINNRSGLPENFGTPEGHVAPEKNRAWEACMTLSANENSHWGFWKYDCRHKTPAQALGLVSDALILGGNLLLNISPDQDGVIPAWQLEILDEIGRWTGDYAEAIYGTQHTDIMTDANSISGSACGDGVVKGDCCYFYCQSWPGERLVIPVFKREVAGAVLLKSGKRLTVERDDQGRLILSGLPETPPDPLIAVIEIKLK